MSIHRLSGDPSDWVTRFAPLIPAGARVLDLACGSGRHAVWLAAQGYQVWAVDRDAAALRALAEVPGVQPQVADLEEREWPLRGAPLAGVVVTNYLHRPQWGNLANMVSPGGVLIYETFMRGQETFGKPSNPDFLLEPNELLAWLSRDFDIVAFEQGLVTRAQPACIQRVCAIRRGGGEASSFAATHTPLCAPRG